MMISPAAKTEVIGQIQILNKQSRHFGILIDAALGILELNLQVSTYLQIAIMAVPVK